MEKTASVGLQGLGLLARIDRTGWVTWKLYFLHFAVFLALVLVTFPILGPVNPDSVFADYYTSEMVLITLSANFMMIVFTSFCAIVLARATEADLRQLIPIDAGVAEQLDGLQVNWQTMAVQMAFFAIVIVLMFPLSFSFEHDVSMVRSMQMHLAGGFTVGVLSFVMPILLGGAVGVGSEIILRQILTIVRVARNIDVDLLRLSEYPSIASPMIRLVVLAMMAYSVLPAAIMIVDDETFQRGAIMVAGLMIAFHTPVALGYAVPIFILRNRIRDRKQAILQTIHQAHKGEHGAIEQLVASSDVLPLPDLLTQQMFVESRWEWPIAPHVQKLLFFGMLPPLTWIMAAVVENLMF